MAGIRLDDPYLGYNFLITLIDSSSTTISIGTISAVAGFSECSGLEMSMEVESYQEGGNNGTILKFPKHITYANIRLKRGITISDVLWQWCYDFVEGRGRRKDGLITLLNDLHLPVKVWHFTRGFPVKWTGPTLNAMQNQVAMQELEIVHEGLKLLAPIAIP